MCTHKTSRRCGFVLIEALIALLIVSFGLLAVSKLQVLSTSGAGEAKSRSEAMALSQKKLEEVRNILVKAGFTGAPLNTGSATVTGTNATYAMAWTVSTPNAGLEQRLLQLTTTWTDRFNVQQRLDLNSLIAWDDPGAQAKLNAPPSHSLISPTGDAQRGPIPRHIDCTAVPCTVHPDGTRLHVDNGLTTYLLTSAGDEILHLKPKDGVVQSFTTITGKIFFDQNAGNNAIPNSNNVRVRLSSEGECIFDNSVSAVNANGTVTGGINSYKYFIYTCYVGPGWYGNVGVVVDDSVGGNAGDPTICVGDPAFHGGVSDSTLISAHPLESGTRSYRGFKGTAGAYLSTGMASGGKYGKSYVLSGSTMVLDVNNGHPFDGRPIPSAYPSYYPAVTAGSATDYFEQNFLVTHITGNGTCTAKMAGGVFARNAGKYFCISPDNDIADDACPAIWPGFESEVGSGGTITYVLMVSTAGNGTGSVSSSPAGISCGANCWQFASGTSVTLTAVAGSGSTFVGWNGGGCSGTAPCTVSMTGATTVTATFDPAAANTLTVTKAGTGAGTVSSSPAGISCGTTCSASSASFASGTSITLTAAAGSGSTFAGWSGGGCSGTGTCTVSVSGATTVTANFAASVTYSLTVTKVGTGTGTVSSAPAGISCGATCSASFASGTTVTLTAVPIGGTGFTIWTGCATTSGNTCTVSMDAARSVTATFTLNGVCTTPISGSAADSHGTVAASSGGSCAMGNGNVSNYSCSLSAPQGTLITLTNARTTGNTSDQYSYSKQVTANCIAQTGVNFP
jgi:type II secretory pathway pseudopilin PulG